jgi:hypothetical protein
MEPGFRRGDGIDGPDLGDDTAVRRAGWPREADAETSAVDPRRI